MTNYDVIIVGAGAKTLSHYLDLPSNKFKLEDKNKPVKHIKKTTSLKELFSRKAYIEFNTDYIEFVYSKNKRW